MSGSSNGLIPGLPLTREQALSLPGMRRYRLVEFLVRWEHFGAARELLESLVAQRTGRFFYQYRLAQCCLATGEVERAKELARALHGAPDTAAVGLLAIGDVFYVEGRLRRAEEYYRQAEAVEKTRESARRRLVWCLLHRRDLDGAAALAHSLADGKRSAQLAPAAVRLLAAVAAASGHTEDAAALRRELKTRWQRELERLRAALELAAPLDEREPAFEEAAGLTPGGGGKPDSQPGPPTADPKSAGDAPPPPSPPAAQGCQSAEEFRISPPAQRGAGPAAQGTCGILPHSGNPANARDECADSRGKTASRSERNACAPRVAPTPGTQPPTPTPSTGYTYPTARERRAATEAAARLQAKRRQIAPDTAASPDALAPARPSEGMPQAAQDSAPPARIPEGRPEPPNARPPDRLNAARPATPDSGALRTALKELFGYDGFRDGQEEVLRYVLAGRSVLATMPTGRGKSLCFQLPAMLLPQTTVVISPLIALMQDQLAGLPARVRNRATVLNSSLDSAELERRLRELAAGRYSLLYAAPERLRQQPFLHALRRAGVSLLVVDEAHCISMWGHDFRPDYLFLPRVHGELGHPPLLAMTATATPAMQDDIRSQFQVPMETVSQGVFRPNLHLSVRRCANKSSKLKAMQELCRAEPGAMIVYVGARARAEHLAMALNEAGVSAGFYHAGLPTEVREATQQRFMQGGPRCLVATVAFGMGVDKPDIRLILHHDLPRSLESYYQEAGRAGRDGLPARCVLLASPGDRRNLSRWAREDRVSVDEVLRVERALRRAAGELTVSPDDLERETGLDDTRLRVAMSVLERTGAARRQFDLPRVVTLQVVAAGDDPFRRFVTDARLRLRQRVTRDLGELCAVTGISPEAIEPQLLRWADAGWLELRGSARGLRLELSGVPDLGARVRALLQRMEGIDEERLGRLDEYVQTTGCRHAFLSRYFGHGLPAAIWRGCSGCDNCARGG